MLLGVRVVLRRDLGVGLVSGFESRFGLLGDRGLRSPGAGLFSTVLACFLAVGLGVVGLGGFGLRDVGFRGVGLRDFRLGARCLLRRSCRLRRRRRL